MPSTGANKAKRVFKFTVDYVSQPTYQGMNEVRKITWQEGTHIDQIHYEIRRAISCGSDSSFNSQNMNLIILDPDDNHVFLNEELDFDMIYKIRIAPQTIKSHNNQGNNMMMHTQNQSLLYSPSTMGGSIFKSPMMGESYHQFRGDKNNWNKSIQMQY